MEQPGNVLFAEQDKDKMEMAKIWQGMLEKLSHELVNHLTPLGTKHIFLQEIVPSLLEGYQLAVINKLMPSKIDQHFLDAIDSIKNVAIHTEPMFKVLRAMYVFSHTVLHLNNQELYSAKACLTNVLGTYPFADKHEILNIHTDNDFTVNLPRLFLESAFIQLLDMAFNNLGELKQKQINIRFSEQSHHHVIHYHIASKAISTKTTQIFSENFIYTHADNLLPGLNFCRLALLYRGGDITCQTVEGQTLEFVISIPHCTNA